MSDEQQGQGFEGGAQPPPTPPSQPIPPPGPPAVQNTSGTGGPVPEEIKGWSWGAFWLHWIWGIAHNVWIALLALCLGPIWMIVLGIKGNEWAWQHRRFDSIEQFKQTQAVWAKWGWVLCFVSLAIWIVMLLTGAFAALISQGG